MSTLDSVSRNALAGAPAATLVVLLVARGGVLADGQAVASLVLATLALPALVRIAAGRAEWHPLGALDLVLPIAGAAWFATATVGIYPGAAVPVVVPALLAWGTFRAAAECAHDPAAARRQAAALVVTCAAAATAGLVLSLLAGGPARAPAAFPLVNHNHMAALLAVALPFALAVSWRPPVGTGTAGDPVSRLVPPVLRTAACLLAVTLPFTVSRAGISAALVGSGAFTVFLLAGRPPRGRLVGAVAATAVFGTGAFVAAAPIAARFSTGRLAVSVAERSAMARSAFEAFLERPVLGWGAGSFAAVFPRFRTAEVPYRVDHAHNEPLEILVESGAAGAVAALVVLVFLFRALDRGRRERAPARDLAVAAAAALVAVLLHGAFDFPLRIPAVAVATAWAAGIGVGAARSKRAGARVYGPDPVRPGRFARIGAAVAACVLAGGTALSVVQSGSARMARSGSPSTREHATRWTPWNAGVWRASADAWWDTALEGRADGFAIARTHYHAALARNPLDPAAATGAARAALVAGDVADAVVLFAQAVEADPAHPAWRRAQVEGLVAAGRIEEALSAARAHAAAHPGAREAAYALAWQAAGGDPEAWIRAVPEGDAAARAAAAGFLAARGWPEASRRELARAAAIDPRGYALAAARMASDAGDPDSARGFVASGLEAWEVRCDAAGPVAATTSRPCEDGTPGAALLLMQSRIASGSGPEAGSASGTAPDGNREPLACARALFPCDRAVRFAFATSEATRDPAAGERAWREAAEAFPADPAPWIAVARLRDAAGDWSGALEAAREAERRRTCEGAGALEVASLQESRGFRAAAALRLEELAVRCPDSQPIAERLRRLRAAHAPGIVQ